MSDNNTAAFEQAIISLLPEDGTATGNMALKSRLREQGFDLTDKEYNTVTAKLIQQGRLGKGRGKGGAVYLIASEPVPDQLVLTQEDAVKEKAHTKPSEKKSSGPRKSPGDASHVLSYRHDDKRKNNPHVGMVDTHSDGEEEVTEWRYDPHINPELQFDSGRFQVEQIIDDALISGDPDIMRQALTERHSQRLAQ